jgi:predicted RNase H-like nuclease (RuvC/YqgF family)
MTKKEKYLKLHGDRESLTGRIIGLRNEIGALKESLGPLEEAALRLEILGDPGSASKKAELRAGQDKIRALEAELDEGEKKARIMAQLLPDLQREARTELSVECQRAFGKAVGPFLKALRETAEAEGQLEALRLELDKKLHSIGLGSSPIRAWSPFLLKMSGEYPTLPEFEAWAKSLEAQGIDLR